MKENWKSVVGYEGLYEVSDLGNVRSLNYNGTGKVRVLRPGLSGRGYLYVNLYKNGKRKSHLVHVVAVTAFRGTIPVGMQVNHLNEIKTDNRLVNLEVVTAKQNINHGTRNERVAKSMLGNTNGNKRLQLTNAKSCTKYTFQSSREASEFFGYKHQGVVADYISKARKRGENFINIRKTRYFFEQYQSGKNEALTKFSELN